LDIKEVGYFCCSGSVIFVAMRYIMHFTFDTMDPVLIILDFVPTFVQLPHVLFKAIFGQAEVVDLDHFHCPSEMSPRS
jgi:hypothetical protein